MATGRMAFPGKNAAVIHDAILNRAPVPVARLQPELPPKLEEIINKALEKDRKLRYQSAAQCESGNNFEIQQRLLRKFRSCSFQGFESDFVTKTL